MPILLLWHQGRPPTRAVTPLGAGLAGIGGWVKGVAARGAEAALLSTNGHFTKATARHVDLNDSWGYLHTSDRQQVVRCNNLSIKEACSVCLTRLEMLRCQSNQVYSLEEANVYARSMRWYKCVHCLCAFITQQLCARGVCKHSRAFFADTPACQCMYASCTSNWVSEPVGTRESACSIVAEIGMGQICDPPLGSLTGPLARATALVQLPAPHC